MQRKWTAIGGAGLGAALMYLFDPDKGRRRRALLRDRGVHLARTTRDRLDVASRDLANRCQGLVARTKSLLVCDQPSDAILAERVRSNIGHALSHPGSIDVAVQGGRVTLTGPVLAREVEELLAHASSVRGVAGVENRLEVHEEAGRVPGLQGGVS